MASVPMANYTDGDYMSIDDPFENSESDYERYHRLMRETSVFQELTEIIKFFLVIAVVATDLYLIIIILKNKKLRSIKSNRLIMHYAIFNILMFISFPLLDILTTLTNLRYRLGWSLYCLEKELESTGVMGLFFAAFGLSYDWFITVRLSSVKPLYQKLNDYYIPIVYGIIVFKTIMDFLFCEEGAVGIIKLCEIVFYLFTVVFLIICNCERKAYIEKEKNYPLTIANVIVVSWVPICVYMIFHTMFMYEYTMRFIIIVTAFIPEYLAYGSPIIIVVWLGIINKDFKLAFKQSCSCFKCFKSVNSRDDASLERIGDNENVDNKNSLENNSFD